MAPPSLHELAVLDSIVVTPRVQARRLPHLREQASTRARSPSCSAVAQREEEQGQEEQEEEQEKEQEESFHFAGSKSFI